MSLFFSFSSSLFFFFFIFFFIFVLFVFFLCLFSLSLSPCVSMCVVWCGTLKTPCVDSTRFPCVHSKRPRVAGIHGDVLNVHTEAC